MKHFKLFTFILILMNFGACDKSDAVIEADDFVTTPPDITFVAGDYYGDENDDGIAKYTMILTANNNAAGAQTEDVFYLTFFSKVVLDAEYALPESGKYTVGDKKALSTLLAGQSKIGDKEYDGSYVVSTKNGAVQESKITEGYIDVRYTNGKCLFKLQLKDEADILAKYTKVELDYTITGQESFSNKAIVYYVFNNPDHSYNRCWYWGPPTSAAAGDQSKPVGEYMFVFSNAKDAEPETEDQVSATFSLMDEYQLYGLDANVKQGVYPVNKESFNAELGTIFVTDLTSEYAEFSSTAVVEYFEDGAQVKYFVVDGWFAIFGDDKGVPNRFIVNFTREDGVKFHGRYDGELPVGDEWTLSDFREDVTQNDLSKAYMKLVEPEYFYQQAGVNQWKLYLTEESVSVVEEEYGASIYGQGDCFRLDISTDPSAVDAIPVGEYEIKDSYEAGVAQHGDKGIGLIGIYLGAWFHDIGGTGSRNAMGLSGKLNISKQNEQYTIEATLYDDAKNTISGKYVGVPIIEDLRASNKSTHALPTAKSIETLLKKYTHDPLPYREYQKRRIENAQSQLK